MNARSCVQELSLDLKHHIRSEFTVDSISQCVLELIENSVDAGASKVSVRVDTLSWNIQVHYSYNYYYFFIAAALRAGTLPNCSTVTSS